MPTWCLPCGEQRSEIAACFLVDGDPMCKPHRDSEATADSIVYPLDSEGRPIVEPHAKRRETIQPGKELAIKKAAPPKLCKRNCGQPVHMGRCRGMKPSPKSAAARETMAEKMRENPVRLDTLEFEIVDETDVPRSTPPQRRVGRTGEIWNQLDQLPAGKFLKVKNRNRQHMGTTARALRKTAEKRQTSLVMSANGADLYVRYAKRESP